jgi:hypothetical protein
VDTASVLKRMKYENEVDSEWRMQLEMMMQAEEIGLDLEDIDFEED